MQEIFSYENLKVLSGTNNESLKNLGEKSEVLQKVSQINRDLRGELEKYRNLYCEGLGQFHTRESSLQKLLEMKDSELQVTNSDLLILNAQSQKLTQDNKQTLEKLSLLKSYKKLPQILNCSENVDEFYRVLKNLNELGLFWRETDSQQYQNLLIEIQEMVKSIHHYQTEITKVQVNCAETVLKKQILSEQIQDIMKEESELANIQTKLVNLHEITTNSILEKEKACEKLAAYEENVEKVKSEKENLANKLEEIYEKLVNERMNSQQILEEFNATKQKCEKILEKLNEEKILKKRLTEQLVHETENKDKVLKELEKFSDLDYVLKATLQDLGAENEIEKCEGCYFHRGNQVNLTLHQETFIVVQEKSGPIPLSDYLVTAASQIKGKKNENSKPELEKSKSPVRFQGVSTPKPQKTPLKERIAVKKPFK